MTKLKSDLQEELQKILRRLIVTVANLAERKLIVMLATNNCSGFKPHLCATVCGKCSHGWLKAFGEPTIWTKKTCCGDECLCRY